MLNSTFGDDRNGRLGGRNDGRSRASGRAGTQGRAASPPQSGRSQGDTAGTAASGERHYWLVPVDQDGS